MLFNKLSENNDINKYLNNSSFYTPSLNYFYKNRLNIINNEINFNFKGDDIEINLLDNNNIVNIKIMNNTTTIKYNENILLTKYTPLFISNDKNHSYKILIENDNLNIIVDDKYNLIKIIIPYENFIIKNTEIKTEYGGWWLL